MSSVQYFYKILNNQSLVEELKDIAVKEFSVENVLFWENYQTLQKMVYHYQTDYKNAQKLNNVNDFDSYYNEQAYYYSNSTISSYSYDPSMHIPKEILPYYITFYTMYVVFFSLLLFTIKLVSKINLYIYNLSIKILIY